MLTFQSLTGNGLGGLGQAPVRERAAESSFAPLSGLSSVGSLHPSIKGQDKNLEW